MRVAGIAAMIGGLLMLAARQAMAADALKTGEYACYGSGGRPLIGLGFKVQAGSRYTDLDDKSPGTYAISGTAVTFKAVTWTGKSAAT